MVFWCGIFLIVLGLVCLRIDRRAAHVFYDRVGARLDRFLHRTTHFAKAAFWLAAACLSYLASGIALSRLGEIPLARTAHTVSAAFICTLALGTAILHTIKFVLGRRRPRDEIEMGRYGFIPFAYDLRLNSFPSGHALTIILVATFATCLWPLGAPLWYALALWLALTRALITAHYLSDVAVGAGIGLICCHIVLANVFPELMQPFF